MCVLWTKYGVGAYNFATRPDSEAYLTYTIAETLMCATYFCIVTSN